MFVCVLFYVNLDGCGDNKGRTLFTFATPLATEYKDQMHRAFPN